LFRRKPFFKLLKIERGGLILSKLIFELSELLNIYTSLFVVLIAVAERTRSTRCTNETNDEYSE